MSENIDGVSSISNNVTTSSNAKPPEEVKEVKLNTIFDVDALGNNDGNLEEEDFKIALSQDKYQSLKSKIEDLYVEFAAKNLGKSKEVGNYIITEVDLPLQPKGVTNRRKIIKDKESGAVVLQSETMISEGEDGVTTVKVHSQRFSKGVITQNDVEFQYNQELLENYIINEAEDNNGNKIKYFSSIPDIRKIPETMRTPEQVQLLEEFDNLVKYSIDAGTDYGMDPKFILSIIQQEVGFQGLSKKVTGVNGKGYMQLTSAPIKDFLGFAGDGKYHELKTGLYGPEMEELLISRGFHTDEAGTSLAKSKLYSDVYSYLKTNEDPEFNIRMGTLVLRYYTNKSNGNVVMAARHYNGSSYKEKYSMNVGKFNTILQDTVPQDTTYVCKRIRLQDNYMHDLKHH